MYAYRVGVDIAYNIILCHFPVQGHARFEKRSLFSWGMVCGQLDSVWNETWLGKTLEVKREARISRVCD